MTALYESRVTLRFFSEDLNPAELTELLGVQPTDYYEKGQIRVLSTGKELMYKRGMWRLEVPDRRPADLDAQITEMLCALPQDLEVWRRLACVHEIDLFCGIFMQESNEGFSLTPDSLAQVSARRIKIDFDVYAASENESSNEPSTSEA